MSLTTSAPPEEQPRLILGLPKTIFPVAGLSIFEIMAFYGTQAILVYYVYFELGEGGLGLPVSLAIAISSAYGGAVFLATSVMGWLADRVLGSEKSLRWGGVIALIGYVALTLLPGTVGLTVGLIAIAIGTAAMWVNEGTIVGSALNAHATRRDAGFTIYYLAGTGGALIGITLTGILQSSVGFQIGFGVTAVAMLIGLIIYLPFRKSTAAIAPKPSDHGVEALRGRALVVPLSLIAAGLIVIGVMIAVGINPGTIVAGAAVLLAAGYFIRIFTGTSVDKAERSRVLTYIPFFFGTLVFCALYQQLYTTVAVHSESQTDRVFLGIEIPPSSLLAAAPLCTIIVAPLLAVLWTKLGTRQPSASVKYAIAFVLCGLALGLLAVASASGDLTPLLVLILIVFVFGASDMVISPTGISMATGVAPRSFRAQMLSLHYLAVAIGTAGAGAAAEFFLPGKNENVYFSALAITAFAVAVIMVISRVAFRRRAIA